LIDETVVALMQGIASAPAHWIDNGIHFHSWTAKRANVSGKRSFLGH